MKITLLVLGKTKFDYLTSAELDYLSRLKQFIKLEYIIIPSIRKNNKIDEILIKNKERDLFLEHIKKDDYVILLDENGKQFSSREFSEWLFQKKMLSFKNLMFIIGGAYGFHDDLRLRSEFSISMSKMTFSHQMIRCFFLEQLYRAQTIIHNLPYHH